MTGLILEDIPTRMWAAVTTGNGGYVKLDYRQVPVPKLDASKVLVRVLAAGISNTEIKPALAGIPKASQAAPPTFRQSSRTRLSRRRMVAGTRQHRSRSFRGPTAAGGSWSQATKLARLLNPNLSGASFISQSVCQASRRQGLRHVITVLSELSAVRWKQHPTSQNMNLPMP